MITQTFIPRLHDEASSTSQLVKADHRASSSA